MKFAHIEYLISRGSFPSSSEWEHILVDIQTAITAVVWPPGNTRFVLNPSRGRGRGEGNGVKPIKDGCMTSLRSLGWETNDRSNPYRIDAIKRLPEARYFGLEWETGNISSSHRSLNRMLLAHLEHHLAGGALIVPTRNLYNYLTDRVGNFEELMPYFNVWRSHSWDEGVLAIIAVDHDGVDEAAPRITKGTDGRALV